MYIIGMALIVIGFLDFGFYMLGAVSSFHWSFMPDLLVVGTKDLTDVAVVGLGYVLREMGEEKEPEQVSDEESVG